MNPQFYINNEFSIRRAAPLDTEMNGLTTVFTAQATVVPGQTYHIKLGVADANDFAVRFERVRAGGKLDERECDGKSRHRLLLGTRRRGRRARRSR